MNNVGNRPSGGEVVGPRLISSVRRPSSNSNTNTSGRALAGDEASSTAVSRPKPVCLYIVVVDHVVYFSHLPRLHRLHGGHSRQARLNILYPQDPTGPSVSNPNLHFTLLTPGITITR